MNLINPISQFFVRFFYRWNRVLPSFGHLSFGTFLIAVLSGIPLALVFDIKKPWDSLQMLSLLNIPGFWIRNIHYWSAQIFLFTFFMHFLEHLSRHSAKKISQGIWFRLVISIIFIFFVMLSGFMLKGDADSYLAIRILGGLLDRLPWGTEIWRPTIVGTENDLQILYMHHIATSTLFVYLVIIEHVRRVWPTNSSLVWGLLLTLLFTFFWIMPVQMPFETVMKGPWYFLALQELLHHLSSPGYFWLILLPIFTALSLLPLKNEKIYQPSLNITYGVIVGYIILTIIGWLFRGANWQWILPWNK